MGSSSAVGLGMIMKGIYEENLRHNSDLRSDYFASRNAKLTAFRCFVQQLNVFLFLFIIYFCTLQDVQ